MPREVKLDNFRKYSEKILQAQKLLNRFGYCITQPLLLANQIAGIKRNTLGFPSFQDMCSWILKS